MEKAMSVARYEISVEIVKIWKTKEKRAEKQIDMRKLHKRKRKNYRNCTEKKNINMENTLIRVRYIRFSYSLRVLNPFTRMVRSVFL